MKRLIVLGTATAAAVTATGAVLVVAGNQASAHQDRLHAALRDPGGRVVGTVQFSIDQHTTRVRAVLRPNRYVATDAFHGFHIHANNEPANGAGCLADPAQPSSTWFLAADGHYSQPGHSHGHHDGDLPSPRVNTDGTATLVFTTDRLDPDQLANRAVILHAGPDNYGNVPTGPAADQYTPNSPAAPDKTTKTGNAGDRVACGLIHHARH
jgi:Cu-Zn family superoxide dismutase